MTRDEPAPVTLLWGDSPFLVREAARALFASPPTEVAAADWRADILADLATPSLFGEERGLLVTDVQALPREALEELSRFATDPPEGARLVLAAVLDQRSRGPSKALAAAAGPGGSIRRVAIDRRELPGWVRERARKAGITASPAGATALVETIGEDPAALDQAVKQLASSHASSGITPETVAAQFRGLGDRRSWELSDAAFSGNLPGALRVLAGLLAARDEPLMILGVMAARVRDLMRVRALGARVPNADVARAAGLRFEWQARRYREQASRFSDADLGAIHADIAEADRLLKQGGQGDVVLARLVRRICDPPRERAASPVTGA